MFTILCHRFNWYKIVLLYNLINLSTSSLYYPNYPEDENIIVNSEGEMGNKTQDENTDAIKDNPTTKVSQGASRLDVSGILTTYGMRQGASMFAMIVFPLLFPVMILVGLGLFFVSFFGTNGLAAVGRRSDMLLGNSLVGGGVGGLGGGGGGVGGSTVSGFDSILPPGYKLDRDGFLSMSLTNRDGFALDRKTTTQNDSCMERFACELLLHGGPKIIGKKATVALLRELNVKPIILSNLSPGNKGKKSSRKVWKCSYFRCNWEKWIPWTENVAIMKGS